MDHVAECTAALEPVAAPEPQTEDPVPAPAPPKKRGGGPRTDKGRESSRWNALRDGSRSMILFPEHLAAAVDEYIATFTEQHLPTNKYETWIIKSMAVAAAKVDQFFDQGLNDMDRARQKAHLCWDHDRRGVVLDHAARMHKDPVRIRHALGKSKQGTTWLIETWQDLGQIVARHGGWTEPQRELAMDLMGVREVVRRQGILLTPTESAAELSALVSEQIEELKLAQEVSINAMDQLAYEMAVSGQPVWEDAETASLRKKEAAAKRELRWALRELQNVRAGQPPSHPEHAVGDPAPALPSRPKPKPKPEPPLEAFPVSQAAFEYLLNRSGSVVNAQLDGIAARMEAERANVEAQAQAEAVAAPAVPVAVPVSMPMTMPLPRTAATMFNKSFPEGNRHERRAREKQAEKAARQAEKGRPGR